MTTKTQTRNRGGAPQRHDDADYLRRAYLPATETRAQPAHAIEHPELDPDHHLWKNGTRWWIAITVHTHDWRKQRIRKSLGGDGPGKRYTRTIPLNLPQPRRGLKV